MSPYTPSSRNRHRTAVLHSLQSRHNQNGIRSDASKGIDYHLHLRLFCGNSNRYAARCNFAQARFSVHVSSLAQMRSSVRSALSPSRAHCQTIIKFHPASRHAASLRWSRLIFFDHFSIQNAIFDFGIVESLHPCLCQKQPRTSIIVLAFGITMSGLPWNLLSQTLYRQPQEYSRLRTSISGKVSLPWIFAISRLRCSGVILSINAMISGVSLNSPIRRGT